jgi:hypothetical protein
MPVVLGLCVPVKTLIVATRVLLLFSHICNIVVGLLLVDKLRHNQPDPLFTLSVFRLLCVGRWAVQFCYSSHCDWSTLYNK